ncbi:MAG: hypothetical protein J7M26_07115 [Armatimonadetes bacterium]|nr:hypothetical protein [Armatimonadota bacterium]
MKGPAREGMAGSSPPPVTDLPKNRREPDEAGSPLLRYFAEAAQVVCY